MDWMQEFQRSLSSRSGWLFFGHFSLKYGIEEGYQYFGIVLVAWFSLHVLLKKRWSHRLIADWPRAGDMQREIGYTLAALAMYAAGSAAMLALYGAGRVEIYSDPALHGLLWLFLSLPAMILWQDFFFYCSHRLLHTRWLLRHVHGVHHRSRQPSPWSAYAMHPVEALINGSIPFTFLMVAPLHGDVLALYLLHQVVRNVHGHAGVESLPRGFATHPIWRLFTTTTHHHMHHETAHGNYGLWFTWWDRVFGTESTDYLSRFERVTRRPTEAKNW